MVNKVTDIFGTEDDKDNCPFYFKIGACRHGEKCIRIHNKPIISETILCKNLYENPVSAISISEGQKVSQEDLKETVKHFEDFYETIFLEFMKYGRIIDIIVLDNICNHLIGNVYIQFSEENEAKSALESLNGKYFGEKILLMEYSPVTDFKDARCRQNEEGNCDKKGFCNFMHVKYISKKFKYSLFDEMYYKYPEYKKRKQEKTRRRRSRSKSNLGDCHSVERRRIIDYWNKEFDKKQNIERENFSAAESKIKYYFMRKQEEKERENNHDYRKK